MQASNLPSKVLLPFADSGTKNTIPVASQVGITPGAASLETGFPPLTFTPLASGGIPPAGADFNGILNLITAVQQWQSAGGIFKYDGAFSTSVGGYPKGAILESSDGSTLWLNLADNNTTDPDGATPANWAPAASYGIAAVTGLTNANVTLTPAQYGKSIITLAGALTGNAQIIFPAIAEQWLVVNNTTGAFAVTCKTASGTGVIITQSSAQQIYGDGTNISSFGGISQATADVRYAALAGLASQVFSVATATATGHATPLGEFVGLNSANGYIKIPMIVAGVKRTLIVQWGSAITDGSGVATLTLPIAFPNAQLQAVATYLSSATAPYFATCGSGSTTQAIGYVSNSSGTGISGQRVNFIVVGW